MTFRACCAVLLIAVAPRYAGAQDTTGPGSRSTVVSGVVTDAAGTPLGQATVAIEELGLGAQTRTDGSYTLRVPAVRVPATPVLVSARLIGHRSQAVRLTLRAGTQTQDFLLADNPLHLGEVVATGAGTVSAVEKLGTGRSFVDSTAIVRSNEQPLVLGSLRHSGQVVEQQCDVLGDHLVAWEGEVHDDLRSEGFGQRHLALDPPFLRHAGQARVLHVLAAHTEGYGAARVRLQCRPGLQDRLRDLNR